MKPPTRYRHSCQSQLRYRCDTDIAATDANHCWHTDTAVTDDLECNIMGARRHERANATGARGRATVVRMIFEVSIPPHVAVLILDAVVVQTFL